MKKTNPRAARAAVTGSTSSSTQEAGRSFPKPDRDSILVCPVGGVGRIGMNFTLYGHAGRWILVDAGSAFAPRDIDGVEAIFPDLHSLRDVIPSLDALIVTHAHEDHIGAIHRIFPELRCPIHATPFAAAVISNRLRECGTLGRTRIRTFKPGQTLSIGPFSVKTIRATHSVPECVALAINTAAGTVVHTGDWKFDPDPVLGKPTDTGSLRAAGDAGVLAMVCDSTNADREGKSTSERDVSHGMRKVFRQSPGMVVVSCFSTNVARLASIAAAAASTGRQVALAGRSLINSERAARETGILTGVPRFLAETRHLRGLRRREMVLVCTGAQGEANAALARFANQDGRNLPSLERTDTVIHSARVIPGNEEDLYAVFDKLKEKGVRVLEKEFEGSPLHVTGHAVAKEIALMYKFVRPRFAIPVHGEERHLLAHAAIAARAGVEHAEIPSEGDVFRVSKEGLTKVATVDVRLVAELSGSVRGRTVPWNPSNPSAFLDYVEPELKVA